MNAREIRRAAKELIKQGIQELAFSEWEDEQDWFGGRDVRVRRVFLGTVFSVMPSGKYYLPWAHSNVDPCCRCKGKGCDYCGNLGSREAYEDQLMGEALEEYAERLGGYYVTPGEGSACDLFLVEEES